MDDPDGRAALFSGSRAEDGSEKEDDSWYVPFPSDASELFRLEEGQLKNDLIQLWKSQGLSSMQPFAEPIAELAERMKSASSDDDADVSPFIYMMF